MAGEKPVGAMYAESPEHAFAIATEHFGRDASRSYFGQLIDDINEANDFFALPMGPIEQIAFQFSFSEGQCSYGAAYYASTRSVEYVIRTFRRKLPGSTKSYNMHEFSHALLWDYVSMRDKDWTNDTLQGAVLDEGIACLAQTQYAGESKPQATKAIVSEAHKVLYWTKYHHRSPQVSGEEVTRYLYNQTPVRNMGYAVGHFIADSISTKYKLGAKELAKLSLPELITMGRKSI